MKNNRDSIMSDERTDSTLSLIDSDLQDLYGTISVPALRFDFASARVAGSPEPSRLRRLWSRPARLAVSAMGLAAAAAIFAVVMLSGGSGSVVTSASAAAILERSSAAAAVDASSAGAVSYHLVAQAKSGGKGDQVTETWFQDSSHFRTETWVATTDRSGSPTFGQARDGSDVWLFESDAGETKAVHGPAAALGVGIGDQVSGAASLSALLAGYAKSGCFSAQNSGSDTVAGRPVFVVVVTPSSDSCQQGEKSAQVGLEAGATTTVSVDQQTFLPLRTQTVRNDGRLLRSYEVSEIEVGAGASSTAFRYEAPAKVTVVEASDGAAAKAALRLTDNQHK